MKPVKPFSEYLTETETSQQGQDWRDRVSPNGVYYSPDTPQQIVDLVESNIFDLRKKSKSCGWVEHSCTGMSEQVHALLSQNDIENELVYGVFVHPTRNVGHDYVKVNSKVVDAAVLQFEIFEDELDETTADHYPMSSVSDRNYS